MSEPSFKLEANVLPYSDGSGHKVRVIVEDTDEGPQVQIEMHWRISTDEWPEVRTAVEDLMAAASARKKAVNASSA